MFDAFYAQYVTACVALQIAALPQENLCALIEALIERVGATLQ
jgi:hypothetical protein